MGAWRLVGDITWWVAACALAVVLAWTAIERGRLHAPALQRGLRKDAAALLANGLEGRGRFGLPRTTGSG